MTAADGGGPYWDFLFIAITLGVTGAGLVLTPRPEREQDPASGPAPDDRPDPRT
ncbi:hypothetical protein [Streptomyces sp. NPDC006638]|uniref:hypothetical protein n=1 Tax=Streptomyces sp. NPDC006638 TaxID=3157183 RepID=UPI0033AC64B9